MQAILFGPSKMDLLIYFKNKALRISSKEVPYLKRSTKGNLVSTGSSEISGMNFILPQTTDVIIVTKNGFVNRIPINNIETMNRRRAGVNMIKLSKGDEIHTIWTCPSNANIIVREGRSQKEIPIQSIPIGSTISTGKKMFQDVNKVILNY